MPLRLVTGLLLVLVVAVSSSAQAAFPGKDGKIAFVARPNGTGMVDVFAMNADGSGQVNLTNNAALDTVPAWSPDGRQIAFMSERDSGSRNVNDEIYKMNADGSGQTRLTNDPARDTNPTWTNDGRIVFDHYTNAGPLGPCGPGGDLYIVNADGTGLRNLTNDGVGSCFANVSAAGKIVFSSFRDGNGELYSINADGSGLARITNTPTCELNPNWSPDGKKLVFLRDLTVNCVGDNDVYVMNADGTGETRLTNTPARVEVWATWSPQGDRLAFGGGGQVSVMSAAGGGEAAIAAGTAPAWQPIPKEIQTIAFGALLDKIYGDRDFAVNATASSGLPVSFAAAGDCAVSGTTVHLTGPGSCSVTASQPGDANYAAAADVSQAFAIAPARCSVPRVVGKTLAGAKAALKQKHCAIGKVSRAYSRTAKKGRVSAQSRRAGQVLPNGTKVNLVVSRGRKP